MLERLALRLTALVYLGVGLAGTLAPGRLVGAAGVALTSPAAEVEIRAVYGGLQLGLGLALLGAARRPERVSQGLRTAILCFLGLFVTRLAGLLQHGLDPLNLRLLLAEGLGLALCGVALRRSSASPPAYGDRAG